MASKYEKTQGLKIQVTQEAATEVNPTGSTWVDASCTLNNFDYTGGQKSDIDITTFCSEETETINGLAAQAEVSISGNWSFDDSAQKVIRKANDDDSVHAFRIIFPSGKGYAFLAEVRQVSFSAATGGVITGTFSLRLRTKLTEYTGS